MNNEKQGNGKFMLGLFLGGIIGALTLAFVGTKEGKKVKKVIEEKGKEAIDEMLEKLDELEEKGKDLVEQGEVLKEQVVDQIEEKKEALTEDVSERVDSALGKIEELQERGRKTTADLRTRFRNLPGKKSV